MFKISLEDRIMISQDFKSYLGTFMKFDTKSSIKLEKDDINKCDICDKMFEKPIQVKKHKCESCGSSFPAKYNLERHMKIHKVHIDYNNCQSCSKSFSQPDGLKRHMKT